ncbi:IclR family transcriptional regulator [Pusillimonas sp.]|uniref:IclR family transcriptional regulator n=1 Tax=Pusillimonas sp. TaxID=3040095 RepID=UPI0029ABFED9|nr:IclR family transcriptional regulator [Pusillimonas sp.]MDX3894216.1 IclR family transcriptional regulator [Pusillimonas sp.]
MSKFSRVVDVLDLFSSQATLLTAEDIAARLQISRPTAFRYARELTAAGFLANFSGSYSLGARIITLDYRIRESDPVLRVARPMMQELASEVSATVVMCRMYNEEVVNVHQESPVQDGSSILGRGRSLPLFRGAASKAMLANLPPAKVRKIYERHCAEPEVKLIGSSWSEFWSSMKTIRQKGFYVSIREISDLTCGIAAPIALPAVGTVAVLAIVFPASRLPLINTEGLGKRVNAVASIITSHLAALTSAGRPMDRDKVSTQ